MAEALIVGAVVGAGFGTAVNELYVFLKTQVVKNLACKSLLEKIISRLDSLKPLIQQIAEVYSDEELQGLAKVIEEGKALVGGYLVRERYPKKKDVDKFDEWEGRLKQQLEMLLFQSIKDGRKTAVNMVEMLPLVRDVKTIAQNTEVAVQQLQLDGRKTADNTEEMVPLVRDAKTRTENIEAMVQELVNRSDKELENQSADNEDHCAVPELPEQPIFGQDGPLKELKRMMFKDGKSMIMVNAIGGSGKTTLAINFCRDPEVKEMFKDNIFFVTVSKKFNLELILQQLLQRKGLPVPALTSPENAVTWLQRFLKKREHNPLLLVLDDVWPESESFLGKFLSKEMNYKILVTSRSQLLRFASQDCQYKLESLNVVDAMKLFNHSTNGSPDPELSKKRTMKVKAKRQRNTSNGDDDYQLKKRRVKTMKKRKEREEEESEEYSGDERIESHDERSNEDESNDESEEDDAPKMKKGEKKNTRNVEEKGMKKKKKMENKESSSQFRCTFPQVENFGEDLDDEVKKDLLEGHFGKLFEAFYGDAVVKAGKSDKLVKMISDTYDKGKFVIRKKSFRISSKDISAILGLPRNGKLFREEEESKEMVEQLFGPLRGTNRVDKKRVWKVLESVRKQQPKSEEEKRIKRRNVERLVILEMCIKFLFPNGGGMISAQLVHIIWGNIEEYAWAVEVGKFLNNCLNRKQKSTGKNLNAGGCAYLLLYWLCEKTKAIEPIKERKDEDHLMRKWDLSKLKFVNDMKTFESLFRNLPSDPEQSDSEEEDEEPRSDAQPLTKKPPVEVEDEIKHLKAENQKLRMLNEELNQQKRTMAEKGKEAEEQIMSQLVDAQEETRGLSKQCRS